MPKFKVETWIDVYSMLTDVFSLSHELIFSDLSIWDIFQIAYNKQAYEGWQNYELKRLQEKGGK